MSKTGFTLGIFCRQVLLNNNERNSGGGGGYFDTADKNRTIPPVENYYHKRTDSKGLVSKPGSVILGGNSVLEGVKNQVYKEKQTRKKITLNIGPWQCMTILGLQAVS